MNIKALYWIALGTFVLALNSQYQDGGLPLAHRAADRAGALFCQASVQAEQALAALRLRTSQPTEDQATDAVLARAQAEVDRALARHQAELDRAVAMRQAEVERMQQRVERVQVVMNRVQVEKLAKLKKFEGMRFNFRNATNRKMVVVCPESGARIEVSVPVLDEIQ